MMQQREGKIGCVTLQEAFRGLDDHNFVLLSKRLQEGKLRFAAIDPELYRGGYECRFFDLNAIAVENTPNAVGAFGGYNDDITISASGVLELSRDIDTHGNPDDEYGFWMRITLDPEHPGRWARVIFYHYPFGDQGSDDEEVVKKRLMPEWDHAAWEGLDRFPGA